MLPLYLLASHLVGDFVFQTRWQADGKFGWEPDAVALRSAHVVAYGAAFLPIVLWRCFSGPPWWHAPAFFAFLILLHWLTDSRRFQSTVGDYVGWRLRPERPTRADLAGAWETVRECEVTYYGVRGGDVHDARARWDAAFGNFNALRAARAAVPPPNPWPTLPLAIDQTLHVVQIAVLAGLFL
jgi:hypothetical protein